MGGGEDFAAETVGVFPLIVLSRIFPARPSAIPEIREFVRAALSESPMRAEDAREVGRAVSRALLDAAGPVGRIQVSFRVLPDHMEVDVLHSGGVPPEPTLCALSAAAQRARADARPPVAVGGGFVTAGGSSGAGAVAGGRDRHPSTFAEWMANLLERQGMTREAAAEQLGVSVKTVGRWIGGETEPRLRDLRRIQAEFGELPFP
jgi:helix-turn-helix protein